MEGFTHFRVMFELNEELSVEEFGRATERPPTGESKGVMDYP